jgi:hypothetical protein
VQVIQKLEIARSVEHIHAQDAAIFLLFLIAVVIIGIFTGEK